MGARHTFVMQKEEFEHLIWSDTSDDDDEMMTATEDTATTEDTPATTEDTPATMEDTPART
jgi:hypothetical protein